jgi:hypothetical protein
MDAVDEIKREDLEDDNPEDQKNMITHNYDDYYQDNFKKPGQDGQDEKAGDTVQEKVEIDEGAFGDEDGLDDLPEDI